MVDYRIRRQLAEFLESEVSHYADKLDTELNSSTNHPKKKMSRDKIEEDLWKALSRKFHEDKRMSSGDDSEDDQANVCTHQGGGQFPTNDQQPVDHKDIGCDTVVNKHGINQGFVDLLINANLNKLVDVHYHVLKHKKFNFVKLRPRSEGEIE